MRRRALRQALEIRRATSRALSGIDIVEDIGIIRCHSLIERRREMGEKLSRGCP